MNFSIEKDWVTGSGLRAVVVIHPAGHRCGYVGVPAGNKHHSKEYDDVPADVHGGLTYAGGEGDYPAPSDGLWWLGYDCAHLGDANDPELMQGEYKELHDKGMFRHRFTDDTVKSLDYCVRECESLAGQLSESKGMKYRKKPVVIEATQWLKMGDHPAVEPFFHHDPEQIGFGWVKTLEGGHIVTPGDYIITGVKGEHYPCKPDIFELTYEPVGDV